MSYHKDDPNHRKWHQNGDFQVVHIEPPPKHEPNKVPMVLQFLDWLFFGTMFAATIYLLSMLP